MITNFLCTHTSSMSLADPTRDLLHAVLQLIEIIIAIFLRESPTPPTYRSQAHAACMVVTTHPQMSSTNCEGLAPLRILANRAYVYILLVLATCGGCSTAAH